MENIKESDQAKLKKGWGIHSIQVFHSQMIRVALCNPFIAQLSREDLVDYCISAGEFLGNLPDCTYEKERLDLPSLLRLDLLDPTATETDWGMVAKNAFEIFCEKPPNKTKLCKMFFPARFNVKGTD